MKKKSYIINKKIETVKLPSDASQKDLLKVNTIYLIKWILLGSLAGITGGIIGSIFANLIVHASRFYNAEKLMIFFFPIAGFLEILIYKVCGEYENRGTNMVILAIHKDKPFRKKHGVLIFISTILSHFGGASVGKEGAALQIGGGLGTLYSELFKLDETDSKIMILSGMSALFASVFGTPIAASVFPIEMISVGLWYYSALFPALIASVIGCLCAKEFRVPVDIFQIEGIISEITISNLLIAVLIGCLCAFLSIIFTGILKNSTKLYKKAFPDPYMRVIGASLIYTALILAFSAEYTGSGINLIEKSLYGDVPHYSFILKIIFSAVAIGAGFKGGEIVPTLTIGACFGYFLGHITGVSLHFAAALGMVGLFAGMTNCPIASAFLAIEMFGGHGAVYFGIVVCLSYALSGHMGLYDSQSYIFTKTKGFTVEDDGNDDGNDDNEHEN